jgi:hypothetical protein
MKKTIVPILVLLSVTSLSAVTLNCPTATGTHVNTLLAGSNGMTAATGVSSGGCLATDQTFGNFGVVASGTAMTTVPTGANVDAFTTSNPVAQDITFNGITFSESATFNNTGTVNITDWTQFGSGTAPATNAAVQEVSFVFTGVNLPAEIAGHDSSLTLAVTICENPTTVPGGNNNTALATFTTCAGTGGTLVTQTFTVTNATGTAITNATETFNVPLISVKDIAIDATISLLDNDAATSFTGFSEDFLSPEPSTFILFGTALAAIGLLRFRARRKVAVRVTE